MKTKTQKFGLFPKLLVTVFAVMLVFVNNAFFVNDVFNLSFNSSTQIIETGLFSEKRMTSSGNIIHRFFTGLEELPFVDYLFITDTQGKNHFIPLRESTSFLQKLSFAPNLIAGASIAFLSVDKKQIQSFFKYLNVQLSIILLGFLFVLQGVLQASSLSRLKNEWLQFRNLVFSTT